MGLEPTRAKRSQEPESCSSANSDTSAYVSFNSQNVFYMLIHEKSSKSLKSFLQNFQGYSFDILKELINSIILISKIDKSVRKAKEKGLCMM